jgi:hypothetical protein
MELVEVLIKHPIVWQLFSILIIGVVTLSVLVIKGEKKDV